MGMATSSTFENACQSVLSGINWKRRVLLQSDLKLHFDYDSFQLSSRSDGLVSAFWRVFSKDALMPDPSNIGRDCRRIGINGEGRAFEVEWESLALPVPSFQEAAYAVMKIMSDSFVSHVSRDRLVMHAATAALGSTAVLFSGPSGSGKTSLALAFSEFDGFVGDECAYLDVPTASVRHEAFPFQLKKRNTDMISYYDMGSSLDVYEGSVGEACYLPLSALKRCTGKWIPLSAVVFPTHMPRSGSCTVSKANPAKLPELILGSLIGSSEPSKTLASFLAMCGIHGIRFYEVTYSDATECAMTLHEFLQRERTMK